MKKIFFIIIIFFYTISSVQANESMFIRVETDTYLNKLIWEKRPIVIFADSPNDVNFKLQIKMLKKNINDLKERDIVVFTDTNPEISSKLRNKLRPRGFTLIIIGKDGEVKLRKPFPWKIREITRVIDKMPIRMQEMNSN